jgi:hypothetical protein
MLAPDIGRGSALGKPPADLLELGGSDWAAACGAFRQRVTERRICHLGDTHLTDAITVAERQEVGQGWRWNVKGARGDIAALLAATAALRALETLPPPAPVKKQALGVWIT